MVKKFKTLIFFLFLLSDIQAQELLTLDKAIEIGLKNNYDILVAKNQSEIDANNVTLGNAGALPQLNLNATQNNSVVNTTQKFVTGQEQNRKNAKSGSIATGLALNWTLFDGLGMFVSYERLKQLRDMGELNTRSAIETSVENIINTYYNIVSQKQMLNVLETAMSLSQERLKISEAKFNLGSESKLGMLQAKVDYNAERSVYIKQRMILENLKVSMNELLAREPITKFEVVDTIVISFKPSLEELKGKSSKENTFLRIADKNVSVSNLDLKGINALRYPRIGFNFNYNFSQSQSQAGLLLSNQSIGPSYGFTAVIPLFGGFNLNRQSKNARISVLSSKLQYDHAKNQLDASVVKAYNDFNNRMEVLELEKENLKVAQENINAVMERYRIGNISALDVKEAQRSFTEANNRLVSALYDAKKAEIALMRLSGSLVK